MNALLSAFPNLTILQWDAPTDDGVVFEVLSHGRPLRADSLPLLLSALRELEAESIPLRWAA